MIELRTIKFQLIFSEESINGKWILFERSVGWAFFLLAYAGYIQTRDAKRASAWLCLWTRICLLLCRVNRCYQWSVIKAWFLSSPPTCYSKFSKNVQLKLREPGLWLSISNFMIVVGFSVWLVRSEILI